MARDIARRDFIAGAGAASVAAAGAVGLAAGTELARADAAAGADAGTTETPWGTFDESGAFTPSFLIPPAPVDEADIVEEYEADVVVVGMGMAGICAARSALENGASVFAVEKGETWHLHSHQISAVNSQLFKDAGLEMPQEEIDFIVAKEAETYRERTSSALWKYMVEHCGEDFDWYLEPCPKYTVIDPNTLPTETDLDYKAILNICTSGLAPQAGRHFDDVSEEREQAAKEGGPYINLFNNPVNPNWDYTTERWPMFPGVIAIEPDQTEVGRHSAEYVEKNAQVRYSCWAKQLERDETGRVTGLVFADIDDKLYRVKAKNGVILATGSYGGNKQMVDYYNRTGGLCPDPGWVDTDARGEFCDMGEGLSMAAWAGAVIDPQDTHTFVSDSSGGSLGCDAFLLVDVNGKRFMNEDVTGEILGHKSIRMPQGTMWQIFDDDYPDQVGSMPIGHRCIWKIVDEVEEIPLGLFFDPIGMLTRSEVEAMTTYICDTVEELAEKMGVPADTLQATIDRYNELYDKGVDEDFGKRADRLAPVRKPPYYASKVTVPIVRLYYGGVRVDEGLHALNADQEPMQGLYVAGSLVGNRFHGCYPNLLMGQNHAGCTVFGRLAGKNAALGI